MTVPPDRVVGLARHPLLQPVRRLLRPVKRTAVGPGALLLGLALRATRRRVGVVLVFHRVGDPPGDPLTELVPALGTELFAAQLRLLDRRFAVVPAAELVPAAARRRRFGRFPVALTFDDDWSGHADIALPALAAARVPATFFVGGATADGPHSFWFERLQTAYDRGLRGGPAEGIHAEAARIEALPAPERRALVAEIERELGDDLPDHGLRAAAIRRIADAGHEIGFHTRDHDTLTSLEDAELAAALRDGRSALEALTGCPLEAIAYPSGKADGRVAVEAAHAGFRRGYTTAPQPVGPRSDPLRLGRVYPSHESVARSAWAVVRALGGDERGDQPSGTGTGS